MNILLSTLFFILSGLIFYFFQGNFTGSIVQNGYLLFSAGTGFVLNGFSGWVETFQDYIYPASFSSK